MKRSSIKKIRVFSSFVEENKAEYKRMASMTPDERFEEFGVLQERLWGKRWTKEPMKRVMSWEKVKW